MIRILSTSSTVKESPARVVVGVPYGITNVETWPCATLPRTAAREVYIVEEPMARLIGIRLPVNDLVGRTIIDIGGGTTDIAVISLGVSCARRP